MSHSRTLFLHALSPLHVGTGRGEGVIDLPIARDVVTQHPLIPGSGVKGPLRAAAQGYEQQFAVFGPDTNNAAEHASAVRFSDARLLALPVASEFGTFAWVSSPFVLLRWARDNGVELPGTLEVAKDHLRCQDDSALRSGTRAYLGEASFTAESDKGLGAFLAKIVFQDDPTWAALFAERFALVHDDVFDHFARTGTDVRAHIRINPETGTVQAGALWYEESVPAEAIFASTVHFLGGKATPDEAEDLVAQLTEKDIAFGGGKTTGMGLMRLSLWDGGQA